MKNKPITAMADDPRTIQKHIAVRDAWRRLQRECRHPASYLAPNHVNDYYVPAWPSNQGPNMRANRVTESWTCQICGQTIHNTGGGRGFHPA